MEIKSVMNKFKTTFKDIIKKIAKPDIKEERRNK